MTKLKDNTSQPSCSDDDSSVRLFTLINPEMKSMIDGLTSLQTFLASENMSNAPSSPGTDVREVEQVGSLSVEEDFLGLLEATLDMRDGNYTSGGKTSRRGKTGEQQEEPLSHKYSTRTQAFTRPIDADVIEIPRPPHLERNITNVSVREQPSFINDEIERIHLANILAAFQDHWEQRLKEQFCKFLDCYMLDKTPSVISRLTEIFEQSLTSREPEEIRDVTAYYWTLSLAGEGEALYAYVATCITNSACSEASCERIFSTVKWVVGDRRYRLQLSTLTVLVHAILYKRDALI